MNDRPDNQDAPYLPERYRQQVKAKKQRRIYKKLVTTGLVIAIALIVIFLLSGLLSAPRLSSLAQSPALPVPITSVQNATPVVNVTVTVTPGYARGTDISTLSTSDVLPLEKAVSLLSLEYPADTYTMVSANLTDRHAGLMLYEFTLKPTGKGSTGTPFTVFYHAVTGDPYTAGEENARITAEEAQDLVRKAFSPHQSDLLLARYSPGPYAEGGWNFRIVRSTTPVITGTLDAETGTILAFNRSIQKTGRPGEPVLDMPGAQAIADRYISGRNGPVAVNMSEGRYYPLGNPSVPVAGYYTFIYNRMVNNIPCDEDGFILDVDSATGEITRYERHWTTLENAFSVASEPIVLKREATFSALQQAKEVYPESTSGLWIVSAEIRWMDRHPSGVTPRPGSIPLAWKVTFDEDVTQANGAQPAVAWVDTQTGSILDFEYRH